MTRFVHDTAQEIEESLAMQVFERKRHPAISPRPKTQPLSEWVTAHEAKLAGKRTGEITEAYNEATGASMTDLEVGHELTQRKDTGGDCPLSKRGVKLWKENCSYSA